MFGSVPDTFICLSFSMFGTLGCAFEGPIVPRVASATATPAASALDLLCDMACVLGERVRPGHGRHGRWAPRATRVPLGTFPEARPDLAQPRRVAYHGLPV